MRYDKPSLLLALFAMGTASAATGSETMPEPLTLDWCLERATRANPEIDAELASADAAVLRVRRIGALDDPRLPLRPLRQFRQSIVEGDHVEIARRRAVKILV